MNLTNALRLVVDTSVECPPRDPLTVFLKVVEEVGESSTAINIPNKAPEPLEYEAADTAIAAIDLVLTTLRCKYPEKTESEIQSEAAAIFFSKTSKWRSARGLEVITFTELK